MTIKDFTYVVETNKSFTDAVVAVRKSAEAAKWGILGDYDFSEILSAKGFSQKEPFKSIELCAPAHANSFVNADKLTALCMPCSVLVFSEVGKTKIAVMRPGVMMPMVFEKAALTLGDIPKKVDEEIKMIIDTAAK
ncbi:DUF302 domain-containing protein [Candidatus Acetothermia bacterium]|nr:DUF302 domain-containing protein [Candidatus Acetothermia bacterium]MBI3661199.1 DUF302 domain-containing protein [Candidatus Acetothermia bacterium]